MYIYVKPMRPLKFQHNEDETPLSYVDQRFFFFLHSSQNYP